MKYIDNQPEGVGVMDLKEEALQLHERSKGKIETTVKVPLKPKGSEFGLFSGSC